MPRYHLNTNIMCLQVFEEKIINLSTYDPNTEAEIATMVRYTINQMSREQFQKTIAYHLQHVWQKSLLCKKRLRQIFLL